MKNAPDGVVCGSCRAPVSVPVPFAFFFQDGGEKAIRDASLVYWSLAAFVCLRASSGFSEPGVLLSSRLGQQSRGCQEMIALHVPPLGVPFSRLDTFFGGERRSPASPAVDAQEG